ncbi:hypothetical protein VNO77_33049 [Canavalia gladiata]|uniref:Uncharacterized protein n=1 Tax=Canavalia gladiata TaxID=3824 RepID=A0AAN9Q055_CANGL
MLLETLAIPTIVLVIFIFTLYVGVLHPKQSQDYGKNPPGPKALPIIGNLHKLGKLPHRNLQSLATKYGPIMSLKLGQVPAIVISSPEMAQLFLKTHDTVFASRPKLEALKSLYHGSKGMVFSEYGAYWRNIRKLCTEKCSRIIPGIKLLIAYPLSFSRPPKLLEDCSILTSI